MITQQITYKEAFVMFSVLLIFIAGSFYLQMSELELINLKQYEHESRFTNIEQIIKLNYYNDLNEYANKNSSPVGLYNPDTDIYCVWNRSLSLSEVQRIDYHEECHSLIRNNPLHFCGINSDPYTIKVVEE